MKNVQRKKTYPTDQYLKRIKDFFVKNNRIPSCYECGQSTNKILVKRLGTWQAAVEAAIGLRPKYRQLTDEDVEKIIVQMRSQMNRLPHMADFERNDQQQIMKRFKNITIANELVFNDSVRLRALKALQQLTPPGVENASSQEIFDLLKKDGFDVQLSAVRGLLDYSRKEGLILTNRYDRQVLWSFTNKGIQFINQFKGKKDGNRTR
jgi:hypothetical protein